MADFQPQKESKSTSLGTTPCLPVQRTLDSASALVGRPLCWMGSGTSVQVAETPKNVPSSANRMRPKQRTSQGRRSQFQSSTLSAAPAENAFISILEEAQSKNMRCRRRPVAASDVVFLSQRACAQFMFRMPGVNDSSASLLKRMLSNAGKSLMPSESHCVFVVEGGGLHEDLLACAAVAPRPRDSYRWQRAISTALADFSSADSHQSSPLDAVFAAASAAKKCPTFDPQFRKSLDPVGMQEITGTHGCARDVVMKLAAISQAFEDAARSAACDLERVLRDLAAARAAPDPSILQGTRVVFAASNAQRSRGYAITTSSQFVLWHRPACTAPLSSFSSSNWSHLPLPRVSRPMPPASSNPALLSSDVIMWEGLYRQLCIATECAIEAIFCQNHTPSLTHLIAPPLVSRVQVGGLVCLFLQEMPIFGLSGKLIGQKFGGKTQVNIVQGLDSISSVPVYKPHASIDGSNLSLFTALSSRRLYANFDSPNDEASLSDPGLPSTSDSTTGVQNSRSQVDDFTFTPGLVVYAIPELESETKRNSPSAIGSLFAHPMWIELPLISVTWTSNGRVIESLSLTLPSVALSKFCITCEDDENHPNFAAAVSVSCDVAVGRSNLRYRPASASDVTRTSLASTCSAVKVHMRASSSSEVRWSILASSSLDGLPQRSSQWAVNSVKSLHWCVDSARACVSTIASRVEDCFSGIFDRTAKSQRTPCRSILELFDGISTLRDGHGCSDVSFLPMILKQTSDVSKLSLGILYADLICRVSADAIFNFCADDPQMRLALQSMYSLIVDESNTNASIMKAPNTDATSEPQPWRDEVEKWWENSVAFSSCARALNSIKLLPLFQAEFGTARGGGGSSSILETLLQNVWLSSSNFSVDSPKKNSSRFSRAEFYVFWIRAMAARTLQLLFATDPVDWVDHEIKRVPSPRQYHQPLGWFAHIHHKSSIQKTTALCVLDKSLHHYEIEGEKTVVATTYCATFCHLRFLLSSDFVSKLMHSRAIEDTHLLSTNSVKHQDPQPHVAPQEHEPNDDFLPKPVSSTISRRQQSATSLLDVGPLNFNARSQRIPLASTFGSSSWISPVYISPIAPNSPSTACDAGLDFINRIQNSGFSNSLQHQRSQIGSRTSSKLCEPQSTLECMHLMHSLALKLLNIKFVFDLQFVMNALADVFIILGIVGSAHFDRNNGDMLPLNRKSAQLCQDMAATLYLRSMSCSRLNTGASLSMFRMMCNILSNGQATLITRSFLPSHFRDFLCNGDVELAELEDHKVASVALTDVLFGKMLSTHVVWAVEMGFEGGDPILAQTCKRAECCQTDSVQFQSFDAGDGKKQLDWVVSALACPLLHTCSNWLSACNPEAPLNDIVAVSSSKSAHLFRSSALTLANAYATAIAASANPSIPLDVSCVLVGYASMCCKFFGEWAFIEKQSGVTGDIDGDCCPCQLLFGIVACNDLATTKELVATDNAILSSAPENVEVPNVSLSVQELSEHTLLPCMCDMLTMLTHHEHGDKHSSYDPALLCFCLCPSRAFCDVSFKHAGQYCSDSTVLLVEHGLRCLKVKTRSEGFRYSGAKIMSLNASSCLFVGDQSVLKLLGQCPDESERTESNRPLQCLCLDGCLNLTSSFMSKLSMLQCVSGLECLVLPAFEQSSVLMGNMAEVMQQKVKFCFKTPFHFDDFIRKMKLQPEHHNVVDQLGHRSVKIVDPTLQYVSNCVPALSDSLQMMLMNGYREDAYSAHQELMGRFAVATAWCRKMRKEACAKEAILFERNRTKMFAANQWREVDSKTGKVKTDGDEDEAGQQQEPAIEDGSTNLWASNEKIQNVSVMMGRLEKMAQTTAVVRDLNSSNPAVQYVGKNEVFDSVVESFLAIQQQQDRSRYVSLSGNLMTQLRQQKKDFYIRQLGTRARIRTALLHRHVRISARLCVAGQGLVKTAALMHVPSEQSAEYCQHMLNLVANSFEGPGCDGESVVELLRCTPNLQHLSFVRAHPFSSARLMDLMALRMSKTLTRMRQMWTMWDAYKVRLGRMNFQRSIHYERVPVKESIIKDHVGFHDRHCIMASKYLPKLVFLDLGALKHISDMGRSVFFINCTQVQAVLGFDVSATPMTNECLLTLVSRMLPPLQVLFPYLSSSKMKEIDVNEELEHSTETEVLLFKPEPNQRGMMWSLMEHLANQHVENMSWKERQAAAKAKADQERKEKLLKHVALRMQTRRNVLHCKAAILSHQGKTARLRWMRLNEAANFNPALRDSLGLSAKTVMAPETGLTKFGEPRYEYADCTPSMLASSLLRIRFQVLQLSAQCCQTADRIKRNLLRVKSSNRPFDDPFLTPEEIFGDASVLKDPCQVFIKVMVEGQPDRFANRVKGLRLSHDKYFNSCTAGPVDIKNIGDCLAPIMMRQTGYLIIPQISSRLTLEIRCQSYKSGEQMITSIPVKPLLMPRTLDEPQDYKIELRYAPKLLEDDQLNLGLQQAYFRNKHFILNSGAKMGYIQAELTVMSPWQADLMVAESQSKHKKSATTSEESNAEPKPDSEVEKSRKGRSAPAKRSNIGLRFDPNDVNDCTSLAQSSIAAFPLTMKLYSKYDRGSLLAESLLNHDRALQGEHATVRCRAPVGLSGVLIDHSESWEIFKRRQELVHKEMTSRWDNRGFIKKFAGIFGQNSLPQSDVIGDEPVTKQDDEIIPVFLEGVDGKVDARAYLDENRDQDSDFDDVDEPEELELLGDGAMQLNEQLMVSSIGRLVEYCVDTVTEEIADGMTFRRAPFCDFRHMRCLELDNSLITDQFFLDCFDLLIGLRCLSIAGCKRLTSETMLSIAKSPSAPHLQFLNISRVCDWNSEIVAVLCNNARSVLELHMDYDIKPSLTDGCVLLMSQNMKGLRLLSLNGVQSLANESVSGVMEQARNLRILSIEGLGNMNDLALQYAQKCTFITFLSISFAILVTDEGLVHISRCRQLRTLLMQNLTAVTDGGMVTLAGGCGRLQCLDVIGCERLSPRGPNAVVQLCPFLRKVSVDATPAMREWKLQVEGVGSTSNVSIVLNFAAPT